MLWIRLSIRNALRNLRRTLLTAGTVVIATALMTVIMAYMAGVFGTIINDFTAVSGHIRIVNKAFAEREALHPIYENIPSVDKVIKDVRAVPDVVDAEPRIQAGVVITANEEIGDDFTLVTGATQKYYKTHLQGPDSLAKGRWLSGKSKEVVLGRRLAAQLQAEIGDEILMLGQTQYGSMSPVTGKLVGLVGGNAMLDQQAYLPLSELQWLTDIPEGALEIMVYAKGYEQSRLGPIVDRLRRLPALANMEVTAWHERDPWNGMLGVVNGIKAFIHFFIMFLAALAIFNTMSMSVMERTSEIGVMRAMGLSKPMTLLLFLVESVCIGLLGSTIGAVFGSVGAWYLQTFGVTLGEEVTSKIGSSFPMKATVYADLNMNTIITAVILGIVIAIMGAMLPALRASSIQPVRAMRARR